MFINPEWIARSKSQRLLQEANETATNTTWVITQEAPKRGKMPAKLDFDPKLIDSKIFDVSVAPSVYQDYSKVGLTWFTKTITEDYLEF